MIAVANIWLFFFTPQYGLLEQLSALFGGASHNWLGSQDTALAAVTIVAIWKEAGFFMIFYLAALQGISPSLARPPRSRRVALDLLPPRAVSAADADHAVRADQRRDRRVPHRRPHHRDDARRAGQRHHAAALLHLQVGFNFWDTSYAAALTGVLLAMLAALALLQYGVLERRIHYR
jgi:sn-glycerol 3-phosphate transport system permease protein